MRWRGGSHANEGLGGDYFLLELEEEVFDFLRRDEGSVRARRSLECAGDPIVDLATVDTRRALDWNEENGKAIAVRASGTTQDLLSSSSPSNPDRECPGTLETLLLCPSDL